MVRTYKHKKVHGPGRGPCCRRGRSRAQEGCALKALESYWTRKGALANGGGGGGGLNCRFLKHANGKRPNFGPEPELNNRPFRLGFWAK